MSDREEIRVTRIEPDGPPVKNGRDWTGYVTYTLEDGQRHRGWLGHYSTKKAVVAAQVERDVDNMTANFRDGRFIGTRTSFYIGPQR